MDFQIEVRKGGAGVAGACVRIEFHGGAMESTTDERGFVVFDYNYTLPVTIWLDGARRGTYFPSDTTEVVILT